MSHGTDLKGSWNSTQSAIIVKKPNSANLYYIFTAGAFVAGGFHYSIVDMSLNSGLGDVVVKNVQLLDASGEGFCVVRHPTEDKFWIVVKHIHRDLEGSDFKSFLLDSNGLNPNAVTTLVSNHLSYIGCVKASPDGTKIVDCSYTEGRVYYYSFDYLTGTLSNEQLIFSDRSTSPYGAEFSLNSKVLYVSYTDNFLMLLLFLSDNRNPFGDSAILQFDLTASNIQSTKYKVFESKYKLGQIQIGPNNKIYCKGARNFYLSVINYPNLLGYACKFDYKGFFLNNGYPFFGYGLPSFPNSYLAKSIDVENLCLGSNTQFTLNGFSAMSSGAFWDFGDGTTSVDLNPHHVYSTSGDYNVVLNGMLDDCGQKISKQVSVFETPVCGNVPNTNICGDDGMTYDLLQLITIYLNVPNIIFIKKI